MKQHFRDHAHPKSEVLQLQPFDFRSTLHQTTFLYMALSSVVLGTDDSPSPPH
jgi:hypothetical protein